MRRVIALYDTTVGQKLAMALSGLVLFGFVVGHMAGNLKIFLGAEAFNHYAHYLREMGSDLFGPSGLLWIARLVLLACLLLHLSAVASLWRRSSAARGVGYRKQTDLSFNYASRTMRWGGVILLLFIIYHILHLTLGVVHSEFDAESPYSNVVSAFSIWWVVIPYALAVLSLGLHLRHGLWSATQTLGLRYPAVQRWRQPFAIGMSVVIVLGYLSVPAAVLLGVVR